MEKIVSFSGTDYWMKTIVCLDEISFRFVILLKLSERVLSQAFREVSLETKMRATSYRSHHDNKKSHGST